jgi:DNA-binding MurR/RpiR family transcriptional regulator
MTTANDANTSNGGNGHSNGGSGHPNGGERGLAGRRAIEAALASNYERLGPGQRRVIDHLLADVRYGAIISAPELARAARVSGSTVTRAAQTLGFDGYPDLQARLREQFVDGVAERIEATATDLGQTPEAAAIRVMLEDAERVRATAEDLDPGVLREVVTALIRARRVYVFGARGSYGLAVVLCIGLRLLVADARLLSQTAGDLPDQLLDVSRRDVLIGIGFRRLDRVTVEVVRHASRVGATTVAITDHLSNPLARLASCTLVAQLGPLRLMPSYAPGASLVNAITTALSLATRGDAGPHLRAAEQTWERFSTYVPQA